MAQQSWKLSRTTCEAGDTPPYEGLPPPHFVDRNQFYESTFEWQVDQINADARFHEAVRQQQEECRQKVKLDECGPSSTAEEVDPFESYRSLRYRMTWMPLQKHLPRSALPVSAPSLKLLTPSRNAPTSEDDARRDSSQQPLTPQSPNDLTRAPDEQGLPGKAPEKPPLPDQRPDRLPSIATRRSSSTSSTMMKSDSSSDSEETETEDTYRRRQRARQVTRSSPPRSSQPHDDSDPDKDTVMTEAPQPWASRVSTDATTTQRRSPPRLVIQPPASVEATNGDSKARGTANHGIDTPNSPISPYSRPVISRRRPDVLPNDHLHLDPREIDLLHPNTVFFLGCDPTWIAKLPGPILVRRRDLPRQRWERDPNDPSTFPPLNELSFRPKEKASTVQQNDWSVFRQLNAITRRWTDEECAQIVVGWRLYNQSLLHDGPTVAMPHLDRSQRLKVCARTSARFQEYLNFTRQRAGEVENRPEPWLVMRDFDTRGHRTAIRDQRGREGAPSPGPANGSSQSVSAPSVQDTDPRPPIPPRNPNRSAAYSAPQATMHGSKYGHHRGSLPSQPNESAGSIPSTPPPTPRPQYLSLPSPASGLFGNAELEDTRTRLLKERAGLEGTNRGWRNEPAELDEIERGLLKEQEKGYKLKKKLVQDYRDSFAQAPRLAHKLQEGGHWPSSIPKIVDSAARDPLKSCTDSTLMEAAEWEKIERATKEGRKRARTPNRWRPLARLKRTSRGRLTTDLSRGVVDTDHDIVNEDGNRADENDLELKAALEFGFDEGWRAKVKGKQMTGTRRVPTPDGRGSRIIVVTSADYYVEAEDGNTEDEDDVEVEDGDSEDEDDLKLQEATQMSIDEGRKATVIDVQMTGTRSRSTSDRQNSRPTEVTRTTFSPAARPRGPPYGASTIPSAFLERSIYKFREVNECSEIRAKIEELRSEDYSEGQIEEFLRNALSERSAEDEDDEDSADPGNQLTPAARDVKLLRRVQNIIDWSGTEAQSIILEEIEMMRERGLTDQQIEQEFRYTLSEQRWELLAARGVDAVEAAEEEHLQGAVMEEDGDKENERPARENTEANTMAGYECEREDDDDDGLHPLHRC